MTIFHWFRWRKNLRRRASTLRQELERLPLHTQAVIWWWDHVRQGAVTAERTKAPREQIWYESQRALLEWLLNGAPEASRPVYKEPQ